MSQNRVIVTVERKDDHEDILQQALDEKQAIDNGTTGIATIDFGVKITAAQAAQTAMSSRAPGSAHARDDVFLLMYIEEEKIAGKLQDKVDALLGGIDAKIALALSNGFQVKDFGVINKQNFVVVDGPLPGAAKLVAKGLQERSFHEWADSIDNGVTWRYIEPTLQATRVSVGYTVGGLAKFRHRTFTKDGPKPWDYAEIVIR